LFQSDLARLIGVHKGSIQNWERNTGTPTPGQIPSIIRFLGYVPFEHDGLKGWANPLAAAMRGLDSERLGRSGWLR